MILHRLKEFCFEPTDILISFDVVSLFTKVNVPLEETINIIANHIYGLDSKPAFDKATFKHLLRLATSGIFLYRDRCFRQVDGVTMGSPLGPTMANFCLAYFEEKLLSDCSNQLNAPSLYLRYVDDIFCVFKSGSAHQSFLDRLNSMHQNLKFTAELGPSALPFLDTRITLPQNEDETFTSQIFRKKTYTGLILNYSAMCPQNWKIGLIRCLLHRAYTISSGWLLFTEEVDFLKNLFTTNGYPATLFDSCLKRFINDKFNSDSTRKKIEDDKIETLFFIPYIGLPSVIFGKKLKTLFQMYYKIDLRIIYTTFKVKNYFSLKSCTPLPLVANVVYKFNCLCDTNTAYIGKTTRHLATRVKEHRTTLSAVKDHLDVCPTCLSNYSCTNNFSILDTGKNDLETTIKESLHIKYNQPKLNKQLPTQGNSFSLSVF